MAFDFPNAPTIGQTYQGYVYDGEKWISTSSPAAPNQSGVISIQVFTASGQYTPSPNMTTCVIECVGGGGGGGGGGSAAGNSALGGGGGGGGYSSMTTGAATIGISQVVTIGTAGAAGAAGANNGGNGGDTSVGALCIAKGGSAGVGSPGNTQAAGGNGGVAGTGTIAIPGGRGGTGLGYGVNTIYSPPTNTGGASGKNFGAGGYAPITSAGGPGQNYGGGGGGGNSFNAVSSQPGGAGAPGVVIVTEYGMTALSPATAQLGSVRYDLPQGLTANQTAQARANIWVLKKNYIINGAMMVSQENGTTQIGAAANGSYIADMWAWGLFGSTGVVTNQCVQYPGINRNRLRVTVTTADASVGAGDLVFIRQGIEGLRAADLMAGTSSAKTVTIQFGVRSVAGTYCVSIQSPEPRVYAAEYTIAAGESMQDVVKTVTIPLTTTGTWTADNTACFYVIWGLMCGTTYQAPANTWTAGNFYATANQSNFMSTNGNVFELFDVSLTEGNVAPPFMVPDYASELALCKRYYLKSPTRMWSAYTGAGGGNWMNFAYGTTMRAVPSITFANISYSNMSGLAANNSMADSMNTFATMTAAGAGYTVFDIIANARL